MKSKVSRWVVFGVLLLSVLSLAVFAIKGSYVSRSVPQIEQYTPWDPELVKVVESLPVQEGGRIKPFSTWAMYRLYSIHSKRKIKVEVDGKALTISPTEWMLDCLFRPEVANDLPSFRVEDSAVAEALKIKTGTFTTFKGKEVTKKRRDFYSFNEIISDEFIEEAQLQVNRNTELLGKGEVAKGFDLQKGNLVNSVWNYGAQEGLLDFLRNIIDNQFGEAVREEWSTATKDEVRDRIENFTFNYFIQIKRMIKDGNEDATRLWTEPTFLDLRMMPSTDASNDSWLSYGNAMKDLMLSEVNYESESYAKAIIDGNRVFARWLLLTYSYQHEGEAAFIERFKEYKEEVASIIKIRDQELGRKSTLDKVASEIQYRDRKYYAYAMGWFFMAVTFMILLLPSPSSWYGRIMSYISGVFALLGTGYIIFGVVHRAMIMERFPLGKLYDTILVITVVAVLILLFMELLSRRKVCLGVAVTMGLIGMFLANRFEVGNGTDTLKPLVAVLNSDYWLATHVTCISIGYAGGLVSAFISIFYLLARMTGIDEGDKSFRRALTRLAYGAACFTLIFSLVGTILGGVWANDSWGRFWGWDPKENGALMIVLWFLALLHARMAGYIKEWGIHICMVLGAIIIAFSWWGVNFLSTGLHNYGFASGGSGEFWLNVFYVLMASIALVSFGFAWYDHEIKKIRKRNKKSEGGNSSASEAPSIADL